MTKDEILRACELRLALWTWGEIGSELHYEGHNVRYHVLKYVLGANHAIRCGGKYPYIKSWMNLNRITEAALANEFGCSPNYLSKILNGYRKMPDDLVEFISRKSGMSREKILESTEKEDALQSGQAPKGHTTKTLP